MRGIVSKHKAPLASGAQGFAAPFMPLSQKLMTLNGPGSNCLIAIALPWASQPNEVRITMAVFVTGQLSERFR